MVRYWTIIVFCSITLRPSKAQQNYQGIGSTIGISSRYNDFITMDSKGYIWISSVNGAFKYDGHTVIHYKPEEEKLGEIIQSNFFEDSLGFIWTTSNLGLSRYDPVIDEFAIVPVVSTNGQILENNCYLFDLDDTGNLWMRIEDQIIRLNSESLQFDSISPTSGVRFSTLDLNDSTGTIFACPWIAKPGLEIIKVRKDSIQRIVLDQYDFVNAESRVEISQAVPQGEEWVWLVSNLGVFRINLFDYQVTGPFEAEGTENVFTYAFKTDDDNMWITNRSSGVWNFDFHSMDFSRRFFNNEIRTMLSSNNTRSIYRDYQDNVWITQLNNSSVDYGWLHANEFRNPFGSMPDDVAVVSLAEDAQNNIWVSSKLQGIFKIDSRGIQIENFPWSILVPEAKMSLPLNLSSDGAIWAVGDSYILRFDEKSSTWKRLMLETDARLFKMLHLTDHDKLIVTSDGLLHFGVVGDSIVYSHYNQNIDLDALKTTQAFQGESGRIYIPMEEKYLEYYELTDDSLKRVDKVKVNASILSVVEGESNTVWLGTRRGLVLCDLDTENCDLMSGQNDWTNSLGVFSIIKNENELWFSSNQGLWNYDLENHAFLRCRTEDGLTSENYSLYAAMKSSDGQFWFGHNKGLTNFDPATIRPNPQFPRITIKSLFVNGEKFVKYDINRHPHLELQPEMNSISVEIIGINYYAQQFNQMYYRLSGKRNDWTNFSSETLLNFQFSPGKHSLEVYSQNANGVRSPIKTYSFHVHPPFWQKTWFLLLTSSISILLMFVVGNWYLRRRLRQQEIEFLRQQEVALAIQTERNRVASEMHDDIGSGLTSIRILSDKLKHQQPYEDAASKINVYAKKLVESMREIIWSMNGEHDGMADVVPFYRRYIMETLDEAGIGCAFKVDGDTHSVKLSGTARRNVLLIFKEVVNNIIKHSEASEVTINFTVGDDFQITVKDNGKGMALREPQRGNGFHNIESRISQIGGKVSFESDGGLTVRIRFPFEKASSDETKN